MTSPIGFIPQGIYLTVTVDAKIFEKTIQFLSEQAEKNWRTTQVEEYVKAGKELLVVNVGDGCNFVKAGDKVLIASHSRPQQIELDEDPNPYFVIREADILGKLD